MNDITVSVLNAHGIAALVFTAIVFTAFVWERVPVATVCLAILAIVPLGFVFFPLTTPAGLVDPMRFFAGFGHPALIAICALMVVGHGLVVTGALEPVARHLAGWVEARPVLALLALVGLPAMASGLVNDTPLVVLLIPLVMAAAARANVSAGTMLLPINYAVLIGGMATTIGTSTNLIVVALAAQLGVGPFSLFSFYPLVMLVAMPALLYLWLVAPRLLSGVKPSDAALAEPIFHAELHVEPDSWLAGRPLHEALEATGHRMRLLAVKRGTRSVTSLPSLQLQPGDRLLLQDTAAQLKDFESTLKARLHDAEFEVADGKDSEQAATPTSAVVAQMIVSPESPLAGRTLHRWRLTERYGVVVVGVRFRNKQAGWQREHLASRALSSGDILLVQGETEAMQKAQNDGIGLLLDARFTLPRQEKAGLALIVMATVVLLAATKILPIALAALAGVFCLLVTRCLSWSDLTHALSVKVILLVSASLALGDTLQLTGATGYLAQQLAMHSQAMSPAGVLIVLIGVMGLLTNFVSNNAAAAIGTPLGIELARFLGVPAEPFVLAVLFGCNLCYLTPMGYQTNLMVMNAVGYRFTDFVRVGTPLFLIMWLGLSFALIQRYGL